MGIPALCFAHAANSGRPVPALVYSVSAPTPHPKEECFFPRWLWHLAACLSSCFSAVILSFSAPEMLVYPNPPILAHFLSFPFFCCQGITHLPSVYMGRWCPVEISCLGLQAGLSSCPPHVFTLKSFWSYSAWTGGELTVISPQIP